jgi:hypothetical protein
MVGFVSPEAIELPCLLIFEIPNPFHFFTTKNPDQVVLQLLNFKNTLISSKRKSYAEYLINWTHRV